MKAVPGARGTIGPTQRFEHGQLLQDRNSRRSQRRNVHPSRCAVCGIEVPLVRRHFARAIIGHIGVGHQPAVGLHGRHDVHRDVSGIERDARVVEIIGVGLAVGVGVAGAVRIKFHQQVADAGCGII